ncbi:3-oxo-5-alpha-steroid 4-dehydrogenase 2 [Cocos nucifera]|uniref:3-oxo-5-alpha-steroid 4-dehydrogenase 2 n=1 Tax=Cocos nucifera TaxID=13894 RepID=A0A8K0MY05_COCNU|nr:3-oxo-5-alpha-steroid 4-dehydrogenase 2 [Cocos nucifera]
MSILSNLLFPPPPSLFITTMSVITFVGISNGGLSEVRGKHIRYSKFVNTNSPNNREEMKLPSRIGMLVAYTPALIASLASLSILDNIGEPRCLLLNSALCVHFFKRVVEVLFVHQYSGHMILESVIPISLSYFISTSTMIHAQHLSQGMEEPSVDLKIAGIIVFLIGITGNLYHHHLLSKLRKKDDRGYKIPKGALFELVICPHYLFEIIGFMGIAFISQTVYAFSFTLGSMFYLMGRSYATRKWYLSKFKNFPTNVRALIPYIF